VALPNVIRPEITQLVQKLGETDLSNQASMKQALVEAMSLLKSYFPSFGSICQLYCTQQDMERPIPTLLFSLAKLLSQRYNKIWSVLKNRKPSDVSANTTGSNNLMEWMTVGSCLFLRLFIFTKYTLITKIDRILLLFPSGSRASKVF
jgi:hypothetical protein